MCYYILPDTWPIYNYSIDIMWTSSSQKYEKCAGIKRGNLYTASNQKTVCEPTRREEKVTVASTVIPIMVKDGNSYRNRDTRELPSVCTSFKPSNLSKYVRQSSIGSSNSSESGSSGRWRDNTTSCNKMEARGQIYTPSNKPWWDKSTSSLSSSSSDSKKMGTPGQIYTPDKPWWDKSISSPWTAPRSFKLPDTFIPKAKKYEASVYFSPRKY